MVDSDKIHRQGFGYIRMKGSFAGRQVYGERIRKSFNLALSEGNQQQQMRLHLEKCD